MRGAAALVVIGVFLATVCLAAGVNGVAARLPRTSAGQLAAAAAAANLTAPQLRSANQNRTAGMAAGLPPTNRGQTARNR